MYKDAHEQYRKTATLITIHAMTRIDERTGVHVNDPDEVTAYVKNAKENGLYEGEYGPAIEQYLTKLISKSKTPEIAKKRKYVFFGGKIFVFDKEYTDLISILPLPKHMRAAINKRVEKMKQKRREYYTREQLAQKEEVDMCEQHRWFKQYLEETKQFDKERARISAKYQTVLIYDKDELEHASANNKIGPTGEYISCWTGASAAGLLTMHLPCELYPKKILVKKRATEVLDFDSLFVKALCKLPYVHSKYTECVKLNETPETRKELENNNLWRAITFNNWALLLDIIGYTFIRI